MGECAVCRGAHPDWQVEADGVTVWACTHHIASVLADTKRGVPITVRGLL